MLVLLCVGRPAPAQTSPGVADKPRWVGHATVLGANAAIGGLTAAVLQKLRGGSFKDGFARGALGGAVTSAGKRIVVQNFWGAGLLGREVNAVGISMVRNASSGAPSLSRLFLPLGPVPVRLALSLTGGVRARAQLDLSGAMWLAYGLFAPRMRFNLGQSFSSGAPVFEAEGRWLRDSEHGVRGYAVGRSVFLGDPLMYGATPAQAEVLEHERVHVLQQDFVLTAWSDPFAGLLLERFGAGRAVHRYVAVDALDWVIGTLTRWTFGADGIGRFPPELEARFLTGR